MADERKQDQENVSSGAATETLEQDEKKVFDPETATRDEWEEMLAKKDEELKKEKERVLRLAADMDNTRKRLEREASEGVCYANESLLREILPVMDNLDRAIQHGESEANFESLMEGVRMTRKGFLDALGKFGCKPVEALGEDFDPNYHEAMMQQESPEHDDNKVVQELRKGYLLKERLIRPALVVVSKKPKAGS
jgi:molecular chaperone GrpE